MTVGGKQTHVNGNMQHVRLLMLIRAKDSESYVGSNWRLLIYYAIATCKKVIQLWMENFNSLHKGQVRKRAVHKEQTWKSDERVNT
jgi:hypothetical protein